ncbi:hypothetical protein FOA52_012642 [Chlamydomonas sp. UWO 241]|nr:hypothetical protein FOA52_012642 [Chlamydomonas sp. UWO 241]
MPPTPRALLLPIGRAFIDAKLHDYPTEARDPGTHGAPQGGGTAYYSEGVLSNARAEVIGMVVMAMDGG